MVKWFCDKVVGDSTQAILAAYSYSTWVNSKCPYVLYVGTTTCYCMGSLNAWGQLEILW